MGTPSTGLPSFSLRVPLITDNLLGWRGAKKVMDLSWHPLCPFLKNIKIDLYCQLVFLPRLSCSSMSSCVLHSPVFNTLTYMHTQAAPTSDLETTCSLPLPWKSKAPEPLISAPNSLGSPPVQKALLDFQGVTPEALNSLMFWESWESSSRKGTIWV